jgi:chemotaxis protein histidine kinase CheA
MAEADKEEEKWFRVCLNTIVRAGEQLDSERLRILPMGSRVCVVEAAKNNGRRVRIKSPIQGWCSMSSSNGDTILAPIEDPNEVPNTPKSISAKVNALQQRRDRTQQLLEKAEKDEKVKGKVNESELRREVRHLERRVREAELQQAERNKVLMKNAEQSAGKYENNQIVICDGGVVGVVRFQGTSDTGEAIVGLEVQEGSGDCDGTYKKDKGGKGDRNFEVKPNAGLYVSQESIKNTLSPIVILSKLEYTINELAITRNKLFQLTERVEEANKAGAGIELDFNEAA